MEESMSARVRTLTWEHALGSLSPQTSTSFSKAPLAASASFRALLLCPYFPFSLFPVSSFAFGAVATRGHILRVKYILLKFPGHCQWAVPQHDQGSVVHE